MEAMLHITNGTSVALPQTGLPGEILIWADILLEGPVPDGLSLEELSAVRGRFRAGWGWDPDTFAERDRRLQAFGEHEEVVLWFEHDLFDQLLLVQLLDFFASHSSGPVRLSIINPGEYLGHMQPARLAALYRGRAPVAPDQLRLGVAAWSAFRAPVPLSLVELLGTDTRQLPWLDGALRRHFEQYPDVRSGLSRTERQILELAAAGIHEHHELFEKVQQLEERVFMGDIVFDRYVTGLQESETPLLDREHRVTSTGERVLAGEIDAVALNGIDRWLGGVHLTSDGPQWRWCAEEGSLRALNRGQI